MSGLLWAIPGLPALLGALLVLTRPRSPRLTSAVTLGAATATVGLSIWALLTRPAVAVPFVLGTEFGLAVDPLAGMVLTTVAVVSVTVPQGGSDDLARSSLLLDKDGAAQAAFLA